MTNDESPHLDVGRLGDYEDGLLAPDAAAAAAAHLARCGACAARLDALRALLAEAAAAPPSIEPPHDLWPAVRARIAGVGDRSSAPAARGRRSQRSGPRAVWTRWTSIAAAAAVLVVLAASGTTTALRRGRASTAPTAPAAPALVAARPPAGMVRAGVRAAPAIAADYLRIEREYARTAAQLAAAVDGQHGALSPETAAVVRRSLRTIDVAIAEARSALERDPHNPALVEMLSVSYQQKLALLKRTAELPSEL